MYNLVVHPLSTLAIVRALCDTYAMSYPRKTQRNLEIVKQRDVEGLTFPEIAKIHGIRKWTAWEVYQREKKREEDINSDTD